jgi:hypothetical protein
MYYCRAVQFFDAIRFCLPRIAVELLDAIRFFIPNTVVDRPILNSIRFFIPNIALEFYDGIRFLIVSIAIEILVTIRLFVPNIAVNFVFVISNIFYVRNAYFIPQFECYSFFKVFNYYIKIITRCLQCLSSEVKCPTSPFPSTMAAKHWSRCQHFHTASVTETSTTMNSFTPLAFQ